MNRTEIVEVGPRDGLQNEAKVLDVDTRVNLIHRLLDAGARRLEVVSFVRADRVPQMAHAEEVTSQLVRVPGATFIGLVLNMRGAERAVETCVHEINMVVPVTDSFATRNQGHSVQELLAEAEGAVRIAHEAGRSASLTLAVAFGCPFEGQVSLARVREICLRVRDMGYDEIAFADTVGVGGARQVRTFVHLADELFTAASLRFHFHNTRNTGYSNAVAAVEASLASNRSVALDSSIGGFGGCPFAPAATGNIATEDLLYALSADGIALKDEFDVQALTEHARWLSDGLGKPFDSLLPKAGWFPLAS